MINVIVFSKDRACQLDLTLSTLKKYFKEWDQQNYHILYTFSSDFFKQGYDLVKKYHPEFNWVKETNFRGDFLRLFDSNLPYTSFLVDDNVFIDNFSIADQEFIEFQRDENILCLSCRLAPYIDFCYTMNKPQPPPPLNEKRIWKWHGANLDWGYPMSLASLHIFRMKDLEFIKNMGFHSPNTLEATMANVQSGKPFMVCYEFAKCISATNNKVQTDNNNRHDNCAPLGELNKEFLKSKRLCVEANRHYRLNMCHGKMTLKFVTIDTP